MLREMSCEGFVVHRRSEPVDHEFTYRVWMLWLDIDRLTNASLVARLPLSARGGHALSRTDIEKQLNDNGVTISADRIFVLTQPRSFGFSFNPVNFYFCYTHRTLRAILADIENTPWGEKHCYVLPIADGAIDHEFTFSKTFHVSPFLPMTGSYQWRFALDGENIHIAMSFARDGIRSFFAGLYLSTHELTTRRLLNGLLRFPMQNLHTLARIYWQAARLYLKKVPFYSHPISNNRGPDG